MTRRIEYPADADGTLLRRLADNGCDMTRPMSFDFPVLVTSRTAAAQVGHAAASLGFYVSIETYDEAIDGDADEQRWLVYCTKSLKPTHRSVTTAQYEIQLLADAFGGFCRGWGTLGNATAQAQLSS